MRAEICGAARLVEMLAHCESVLYRGNNVVSIRIAGQCGYGLGLLHQNGDALVTPCFLLNKLMSELYMIS